MTTISSYRPSDFARHPLMFYYEVTQACDLVCRHCRASAQAGPRPDELSSAQSRELIAQIASFERKPVLVLTGGDPLKRRDIYDLIRYAKACGLEVALTPSATPLATKDALIRAKEAGVRRLGISLDGPDAETHDAFRGWSGSFDRTMAMIAEANSIGLPVQINTSITARNVGCVDRMAELLADTGIVMWSVFFLVPVGRGSSEKRISGQTYETVFEQLWGHTHRQSYAIKTTEAPHYRRWVLQRGRSEGAVESPGSPRNQTRLNLPDAGHRAPLGVRDGNGIMFVGHDGVIFPAGFLPVECGRFPEQSVVEVYQQHPIFLSLRDPDGFKGKCGVCEFRQICGGSRSRAFGVTGDILASEPDCVYEPVDWTAEALAT